MMKVFNDWNDVGRMTNWARILAIVILGAFAGLVQAGQWTFEKVADRDILSEYGVDFSERDDFYVEIEDGRVAFTTGNNVFKYIDGQLEMVVGPDDITPDTAEAFTNIRLGFDGTNVLFRAGGELNGIGKASYHSDSGGELSVVLDMNTPIVGTEETYGDPVSDWGFLKAKGSGIVLNRIDREDGSANGIYKFVDGYIYPIATNETMPKLSAGEYWRYEDIAFNGRSVAFNAYAYDADDDYVPGSHNMYTDISGTISIAADYEAMNPGGYANSFIDYSLWPMIVRERVMFAGYTACSPDGACDSHGIYQYDGEALSVVVEEGQPLAGSSVVFENLGLVSSAGDSIYLSGITENDWGYYRLNEEGLTLIVDSDYGVLADGSGITYQQYFRHGPNYCPGGDMALIWAELRDPDTGGDIADSFVWAIGGQVFPFIKEGDMLDGQIVAGINWYNCFNWSDLANGHVALELGFENGERALYLATIPEPGVGVMVVAGMMLALGRRC